jgi:hypothetical protein
MLATFEGRRHTGFRGPKEETAWKTGVGGRIILKWVRLILLRIRTSDGCCENDSGPSGILMRGIS